MSHGNKSEDLEVCETHCAFQFGGLGRTENWQLKTEDFDLLHAQDAVDECGNVAHVHVAITVDVGELFRQADFAQND